MNADQLVHIVVVTYNRIELTRQCLPSLKRCADHPHVLSVVDKGSQDGTREYLRELQKQGLVDNVFLLSRNMGISCAANFGWAALDAPFSLRVDNDMLFKRPGWLSRMVALCARNPEIGMLALHYTANEFDTIRLRSGDVACLRPGLGCPGCCTLIRRDVHERLGFWCEDYGLYGEEDADYSHRALLAGLVCAYLPTEDGAALDIDCVEHKGGFAAPRNEYETFKCSKRSKNVDPFGNYSVNLMLYGLRRRELHMPRKYLPRLNPDGTYSFQVDPGYRPYETKLSLYKRMFKLGGLDRTLAGAAKA